MNRRSMITQFIVPIETIHLYLGNHKLPNAWNYAFGEITEVPFLVVQLYSEGIYGVGECFLCKDSIDELVSDFVDRTWELGKEAGEALIGKDATYLEGLIPKSLEGSFSSRVREAYSMALYDLVGKARNLPVTSFLGGARRTVIPGMPVIHLDTPEKMATVLEKWLERGYKYIKVKLEGNKKKDLAIFDVIGPMLKGTISTQVDMNRGYRNIDEVKAVIHELEKWGVDVVEDPADVCIIDYKNIRGTIKPRLMIDNLAHSIQDVMSIAKNNAADIINQHPSHQGGFLNALKIAYVAESVGITTAIGSAGFLGIADAAYQSLAAVIGLDRPCEEVGGYQYCGEEALIVKEPNLQRNGNIYLSNRAGLGVELDMSCLEKKLIQKHTISH
jgi:O-succinylbenzoate synthase